MFPFERCHGGCGVAAPARRTAGARLAGIPNRSLNVRWDASGAGMRDVTTAQPALTFG